LAGEVRDLSDKRAGICRAPELAGLPGWRGKGGSPAGLGRVQSDQVRGIYGVF
jgi:hypothetical protein